MGFLPGRWTSLVGLVVASGALAGACSSTRPSESSSGVTSGSSSGDLPRPDAEVLDAQTDADSDATGPSDASVDQRAQNGPCLDDKPALASQLEAGAPRTCPSTGSCATACGHIGDRYKLGVAQVAIDCLLALPSCDNANDVRLCVDRAMARACDDATAKSYCASFVTACDPNAGQAGSSISQDGCVVLSNGLSATGRADFKGCIDAKIAAGTCPLGVVDCADEIRQ